MADMNAGIILQGQTPDIMGSFSNGMAIRSQQNALATQENLSNLYRTQGAQILAGDQQALNALAGIDPMQAMGVQQGQLGMDATRHGMQMDEANLGLRQEELAITKENARMRGLEFAAQMDAQTAAQAAAELERAIAMGSQAQTPEQWDAVMAQLGPDGAQYIGQFESRDMIIAGALGLKEALAMGQGPEPTASQRDYQFYADQEAQSGRQPLSFNDWDLQSKKAAAATTTVNTTVTPGATGDSSTRPGQVFDEMKLSAESARSAVTGLRALKEAEKALQGGAITGFGADVRLGAAKLGALMGITDPSIISNTETFRAAIAPQVAAMIKATVGSAQLSNADREFAEKAAGGNISLDETTITRLLDIMTRASEAAVKSHNDRLNTVYPEGSGADRERALFAVNNPNEPQDDGTGIGTIEDGYRYIGGDSSKPEAWEPAQ